MEEIASENKLIDIIYETAVDPSFWPLILEGFSNLMEKEIYASADKTTPQAGVNPEGLLFSEHPAAMSLSTQSSQQLKLKHKQEEQLTGLLIPHFRRAYLLSRHITRIEQERDLYKQYYDKLFIGVVVIDRQFTIKSTNLTARKMISSNSALSIDDDHLCFNSSQLLKNFSALVSGIMINNESSAQENTAQLLIPGVDNEQNINLYLSTVSQEPGNNENQDDLLFLYLTTQKLQAYISTEMLQQTYHLTPKESEVAKKIASGFSAKSIAAQSNVKIDTIRGQLKSIFLKTNTHSQNSLTCALLSSPAAWSIDNETYDLQSSMCIPQQSARFRESQFTLSDGRTLAYAEYGDLDGYPVYFCHTIFGCRYQRFPYDEITAKQKVRLIVPDRPGFGLSDKKEDYTYLDWADDFAELNTHLGIEQSSIISLISGSPFALACAIKHPHLFNKVMLFASLSQVDSFSDLLGLAPFYRLNMGLAYYTPKLLRQFLKLYARGLQKQPFKLFKNLTARFSQHDQNLMTKHPEIETALATSIYEQGRKTSYGLYNEALTAVRPWGFSLADIDKHIDLYYGEYDTHATPEMKQKLATLIPDNTMHIIPNTGTFALFEHWQAFLEYATTQSKN